jgi:hypothetical protein
MEEQNLPEESNQPETKPSNTQLGVPIKTIALIVLLAFIACVLVYIAVSPKKPSSVALKTTTNTQQSNSDTTLSILKNQSDPKNQGKYYSEVQISTGKNKINAVQLELAYDPTALTNVDIVSGGFFSPTAELLKKIDPINGTITYAISVPAGQSSVGGTGVVARIYYSPVSAQAATITTINFRPKTGVSSLEEAGSLLKATNDGVVEILVMASTPTSAPTIPAKITPEVPPPIQ